MRHTAGATPEALLELLAEGLLLALLAFAPWALGGVPVWSSSLLQAGAALLIGAWACRSLLAPPSRRPRRGSWSAGDVAREAPARAARAVTISAAALIGLTLLHLVPLPGRAIRSLSPAAAERFALALPGGEEAASGSPPARPLSLDPAGTLGALLHMTAATAVFVAAAGLMRRREATERAAWVVALTGVGVSVFGVVQSLQGDGHIYGIYPRTRGSPYGPFLERDQYAAYAVMAAALAFGLLAGRVAALRGLGSDGGLHPAARRLRGRPDAAARLGLSAFAALLILAGLVHSGSRTAPLGLALSMAILGVARWGRTRPALAASCAAAGVVALAAAGAFVAGGSTDVSARFGLWRAEASMASRFPAVGAGPGTLPVLLPAAARGGSEALRLAAETGAAGVLVAIWGFLRLAQARPLRAGAGDPGELLAGSAAVGLLAILIMAILDAGFLAPAVSLSCAAASAIMVAQARQGVAPAMEAT